MTAEALDFQAIHDEFHEKIRFYLGRLAGEAEAEDLAQEVFVKVSRSLASFEGKSKLSTWVYRIATNTALDKLRSRSFRQDKQTLSLSGTDDGTDMDLEDRDACEDKSAPTADREVVKAEMSECIREFVDRLPPDYRAAIVLSELKDLKNQEIADILGVTLDTVKIRLHRARSRLKKEFESGCTFHRDDGELACDRKCPDS